jgi:hypothetical protein
MNFRGFDFDAIERDAIAMYEQHKLMPAPLVSTAMTIRQDSLEYWIAIAAWMGAKAETSAKADVRELAHVLELALHFLLAKKRIAEPDLELAIMPERDREGETAGPLNYALGYDHGFAAGRREREAATPMGSTRWR